MTYGAKIQQMAIEPEKGNYDRLVFTEMRISQRLAS